MMQFVVFTLDTRRFALHLSTVMRVLPAMEITPLPQAPVAVSGLVNLEGTIFPVFNTRRRFGFPERELDPSDRFIVADATSRTALLVVDDVIGVFDYPEARFVHRDNTLVSDESISGVVTLDDGLIYIHDLDSFLSSEEEIDLDEALRRITKEKQPGKSGKKRKVPSDG